MNKIILTATGKRWVADTQTPVSIYLKIRDRYPNSILLESADYHSQDNSYSFICFNPIAGFVVTQGKVEIALPGRKKVYELEEHSDVLKDLSDFMDSFDQVGQPGPFRNGLFGYMGYDAVKYFEQIQVANKLESDNIPEICYHVYQNVISINHFNDEAWLYSFSPNSDSNLDEVLDLMAVRSFPTFHFKRNGEIQSNHTDETYKQLVEKGKEHCQLGDVFQIVFSRRFSQSFWGDDFNVYRALRSVNPSPYLFYFDYGSYKIFGSSPESQLVIKGDKAYINPIAGTFKRTGNDKEDEQKALLLSKDPKETAEHTMLVDLARNDLSIRGTDVVVEKFKEVQFYSHVIHLVSTVSAKLGAYADRLKLVGRTFPAGTLTGAPKYRAMELIESYESVNRQFYGGAIGFISFDRDFNHAIIIRSFLSRDNTLHFQAGAGIVAASDSQSELQEVYNKLEALNKAIELAENI
ncbi:MAG TPA: anthranilate synthase component I family protein [Luteibaculaceae bacterium]|nr:anthranilate synthase component I family protein [Luteibaculaceae bacterium]